MWESLIFGLPVIVFGSTPAIASRVVIELSWLVQHFVTPESIRDIPLTDQRFSALGKKPKGIIDVSNLIVFVKVGFPRTVFWFPFGGRVNSREKPIGILRNTERLGRAVRIAFQRMAESDPNGFAKGEINVETEMSVKEFARRYCVTKNKPC